MVIVSFEQDSYTVSEVTGSLPVCVTYTGALERSIEVTLTSSPTTSDDFTFVASNLAFSSEVTRICRNVSIIRDIVVEDSESFDMIILTSDPAVQIASRSVSVVIVDSSDVRFVFQEQVYEASEGDDVVVSLCVVLVGELTRDISLTLDIPGSEGMLWGKEM